MIATSILDGQYQLSLDVENVEDRGMMKYPICSVSGLDCKLTEHSLGKI